MRKTITLILCAAALSATSLGAAAHGSAGGGHWSGGSTGSPSNPALLNSNGTFAADRDFGQNRAEDRMSAQGLRHEQAASRAAVKHHGRRSARPGTAIDADGR